MTKQKSPPWKRTVLHSEEVSIQPQCITILSLSLLVDQTKHISCQSFTATENQFHENYHRTQQKQKPKIRPPDGLITPEQTVVSKFDYIHAHSPCDFEGSQPCRRLADSRETDTERRTHVQCQKVFHVSLSGAKSYASSE